MSKKGKKDRVIHVENLVIHAKNVDIIHEKEDHHHKPKEKHESIAAESPRRSPWDSFLWGGMGREDAIEDEKN